MGDVFANGYDLDGSFESFEQAIVDPCWIIPAWVDGQSFIVDVAVPTCVDQLTLYFDGAGVAWSIVAAGSVQTVYYLAGGDRAELDCLIRD